MIVNLTGDALLGSIPWFAHLYDFFNRAGQRHLRLWTAPDQDGAHQGRAGPLIFPTGFFVLLTISGFINLTYWRSYQLLALIFSYYLDFKY